MAWLLEVSIHAVYSHGQGWRHPCTLLQRTMLLPLIAHRHGGASGIDACWIEQDDPWGRRDQGVAYRSPTVSPAAFFDRHHVRWPGDRRPVGETENLQTGQLRERVAPPEPRENDVTKRRRQRRIDEANPSAFGGVP